MNIKHSHFKALFLLTLTFIVNLSAKSSFCQENYENKFAYLKSKDSLNAIYGLDPILYNGKLYNKYYAQNNIIGNQYINSEVYLKGDITIRGNKFDNLSLNYDIYNQELLLKFINPSGFTNIIMISKAWLEEFTIGDSKFKYCIKNNFPDRVYQVIGNERIQIYYFIKKDLKLNNVSGSSSYIFNPSRFSYLIINDSLHEYKNNRSFKKIFDITKQPMIKKYLRYNKIKVSKAPDKIMEQLINYCNSI